MGDLQLIGRGRLAEVYAWGETQVLKLFAVDCDISIIEDEARATQVVHDTGIACPAVHGIVAVDGRNGIVLDRAPGSPMLGLLSAKPWKVFSYGRLLADIHLSVHICQTDQLSSQSEQFATLITRADLSIKKKNYALKRLRSIDEGTSICHGDFHPDNVLINGKDAVIIDWATACVGNPLLDFARTSLILQLGAPLSSASLWTKITINLGRKLFHNAYQKRYLRLCGTSAKNIQHLMLPVAVARLGMNIDAEREQLLSMIKRLSRG